MSKPRQLNYEEQLNRLCEYGITCEDKDHKINIDAIKSIGYYNLKTFALPFTCSQPGEKLLFKKLSFNDLVTRYYQDKNLRIYLLHAIECIEVYLKNCFSYILGQYGAFGYLSFNSWCSRNEKNRFFLEKEQYKFKKLILYNLEKTSNVDLKKKDNLQEGFPSVWLMMNTLTLGQTTHLIKIASRKNKNKLASCFKTDRETLESWIDCLLLVRNICCHNSDLLDLKLKTHPKIPEQYKSELFKENEFRYSDRISIIIFIIAYMMESVNPKYDFRSIKTALFTIIKGNDSLANMLGFKNKKSINKLKTTRSYKNKFKQ